MSAAPAHKPIVHFVGSIPLPDAETVFRTLAAATGRRSNSRTRRMVSLCAGICSPSVDRGSRREVDADPRATSPVPFTAATSLTPGEAAGFKSERWPLSNRNRGRLQIGTVAGIKSEKVATFDWNLHLCGLAIGYPDPEFPQNKLHIGREPIGENVVFLDN